MNTPATSAELASHLDLCLQLGPIVRMVLEERYNEGRRVQWLRGDIISARKSRDAAFETLIHVEFVAIKNHETRVGEISIKRLEGYATGNPNDLMPSIARWEERLKDGELHCRHWLVPAQSLAIHRLLGHVQAISNGQPIMRQYNCSEPAFREYLGMIAVRIERAAAEAKAAQIIGRPDQGLLMHALTDLDTKFNSWITGLTPLHLDHKTAKLVS